MGGVAAWRGVAWRGGVRSSGREVVGAGSWARGVAGSRGRGGCGGGARRSSATTTRFEDARREAECAVP